MSKIIEEIALEYCRDKNIDVFSAKDLPILYEIYERAEKRKHFKPLKSKKSLNILRRIRNGMRTGYYFDRTVIKVNGEQKVSFYKRKEIKKCPFLYQ